MVAVSDPKMSYDFAGLGALKADAVRDRSDEATIKKTAQQFEAMFLQMMMKSMRATVQKGGLFDSSETETFEQMLDQQFGLQRVGVIEVRLNSLVEIQVRQVPVVGVVLDEHHLLRPDRLDDGQGDRRLPGAGTP